MSDRVARGLDGARRQLDTKFRRRHRAEVPIPHVFVWLQHSQYSTIFFLTEVSHENLVLSNVSFCGVVAAFHSQ